VVIGGAGAGGGYTQSYGYDALNRLSSFGDTGGVTQGLSYDQYGNMFASQTGLSGVVALGWMPTSQSQITAANNHLTVSGVQYDSAGLGGNQTTLQGVTLTYDAENRQVQSYNSVSGNTYTYGYDGLGQRVSRTISGVTTIYAHDAFGNLATEYNPPVAAACTTCYLSWDHLGSTRMVTDGSGNVIARRITQAMEDPAGGSILVLIRMSEQGAVIDVKPVGGSAALRNSALGARRKTGRRANINL